MDRRIEQGRTTRQQLIDVATRLFAERGYQDTPIEAVLEKSGVSRGALYHHFESKEGLFEAVLEAIEERIAAEIVATAGGVADPIESLRAGAIAWLRLSKDPVIRRISLIDAPSVVGWERWRAIDEKHGFGLLKMALQTAASAGLVAGESVDMIAHVLLAATLELALVIARSGDPDRALESGETAVSQLIDGLFAKHSRKR
jgi:AcrR family transcriptional regulator